MIDSKTNKQTLVSRKQYRLAKRKIINALELIDEAKQTIKVLRPSLVAYALKDTIDYKKYVTYDKWLVEEYLQGIDYEDETYSLYADMMVTSINNERTKKYE